MGLCLLTPTRERPEAFRLLESWMSGQDRCWDRWIVATDNDFDYHYTLGQTVIRGRDFGPGHHSFCGNLRAGLRAIPEDCDKLLIIEDDDWYHPCYLRIMSDLLDHYQIVGDYHARYYHVGKRRWKLHRNATHASLAQTGLRRPLVEPLGRLVDEGGGLIDQRLWSLPEASGGLLADLGGIHVGIKGLPGPRGLGSGHDPDMGKLDDGTVFCDWGIPAEYLVHQANQGSKPLPEKMVTIQAHGNKEIGYGRLADQVGMCLEMSGVRVRYELLSRGPLTKFMAARVEAIPSGNWILRCVPPGQVRDSRATCWYTMWETTRVSAKALDALKNSHGVLVPSAWQAACFSGQGVDAKIHVAPLGVNATEGFFYRPLPEGPFVVGMAGNINHGGMRKNLDAGVRAWIDAFRGIDGARLHVKVRPDNAFDDFDDARIVIDRRPISTFQMADWYQNIHVLLVPSRGEGWGMHTHEAMATGRPVIACKWSGTSEFFDDQCGWEIPFELVPAVEFYNSSGVWAEPSHDGMVKAMLEAYAKPDEVERRSQNAARRASEFTWARTGRELNAGLVKFGMIRQPSA